MSRADRWAPRRAGRRPSRQHQPTGQDGPQRGVQAAHQVQAALHPGPRLAGVVTASAPTSTTSRSATRSTPAPATCASEPSQSRSPSTPTTSPSSPVTLVRGSRSRPARCACRVAGPRGHGRRPARPEGPGPRRRRRPRLDGHPGRQASRCPRGDHRPHQRRRQGPRPRRRRGHRLHGNRTSPTCPATTSCSTRSARPAWRSR